MNFQDRRLFNELKYFKKNYNDINFNIKNEVIEFVVQNPKEKGYPKVKFVMIGFYPFNQPIVYVFINGEETKYLKILPYHSYPRIIKCIENLKKIRAISINGHCLCCNNILCDGWSPACDLEKIVEEIKQVNYIKQQVKKLITVNNLGKKYGLSDDIELYIYKFL